MTSKPQIRMILNDGFADVYAFATLYDYLIERDFPAKFSIAYTQCDFANKFLRIVKNQELKLEFCATAYENLDRKDIMLAGYSDINCGGHRSANVFIDHSILKNCVKPLTEDEREELRKKHEISLKEKVLVVGFPHIGDGSVNESSLRRIISELHSKVKIYFVGNAYNYTYLDILHNGSIRVVNAKGVLREYYAMADASLIDRNVDYNYSTMHNFIEATAGGPLFLVKPWNSAQYGYKQLLQREVIREAENTEDLIDRVKKYFENPQSETVRKQRSEHLEHSRRVYLSDLERLLKKILKISNEQFQSDLTFDSELFSTYYELNVYHPETRWSWGEDKGLYLPIKKLTTKRLELLK